MARNAFDIPEAQAVCSTERDVVDRYVECGVRVDSLDDAGAAGRDNENGVWSCCFEHIAEGERIAAPGTCGSALQHEFFFGDFCDGIQLLW